MKLHKLVAMFLPDRLRAHIKYVGETVDGFYQGERITQTQQWMAEEERNQVWVNTYLWLLCTEHNKRNTKAHKYTALVELACSIGVYEITDLEATSVYGDFDSPVALDVSKLGVQVNFETMGYTYEHTI